MQSIPGANHVARRPSDKKALVEYIEATQNLQETDWLEWKSGYDLTTSTGRASTARHIIGFANRMPDHAKRYADGHAYLVLGVEPGSFHGVAVHDSADVENWLRPYVGDDIVYDIDYVTVGGVAVLLITVDPPDWGDGLHSLRKESQDEYGKHMRKGAPYVRKAGKTETASDTDLDRLVERARRRGTELELTIAVVGPIVAPDPARFTDEARDEYLRHQRSKMLAGLPEPGPFQSDFTTVRPGETRSRQQFTNQVEVWVARVRRAWEVFALLEAVIPLAEALVRESASAFHEETMALAAPAPWGQELSSLTREMVPGRSFDQLEIEALGEDRTQVSFPPVHVRPKSRPSAGSVVLAVFPNTAGVELEVEWRVTSTSTRGDLAGTMSFMIEEPAED